MKLPRTKDMPFRIGRGYYLDVHANLPDNLLSVWICDGNKFFLANSLHLPDDVKRRAAFWATVKFPLYKLPMDLEAFKRQLFREYYMDRHRALANYLEWQAKHRAH